MDETIVALQKITLSEGVIALALGIMWFVCRKNEIKLYSFAILTYFIHLIVYYTYVLFLIPEDVMRWSVLLRLHGITLHIIMLATIIILKRETNAK